jgi:putative ABC transport system ATP-binding protein
MNSNPTQPFIQLQNLSRCYAQGGCQRPVLSQLNGVIQRGESVALLGRSGCGKSTLLNLIGGIDQPDEGTILIDGVAITDLDEHARTLFRRRHIGFVYQFYNLVPTLTVEENLLLPLELNGWSLSQGRERARELLQAVDLLEKAMSFPDQLSGGEQQRVAVARALVHQPDLILADEPTGNLDAESGEQVLALLEQLVSAEQCTLLMVTHSQAVAKRADRIFTLLEGRLSEAESGLVW